MQNAARIKALRTQQVGDALVHIREKFTRDLAAQAESIDVLMMAAEAAADPTELLRRIMAIVHRLYGVAGILGFGDLGAIARRCEERIGLYVDGQRDGGALGEIGDLLDELVVQMERRAGGEPSAAAA